TGTPRHFHSSIASGSACLMRARIRVSVSPRQSPSSSIFASISREGECPAFPSFEPLFFTIVVAFFMLLSLRSCASVRALTAAPFGGMGQHEQVQAREQHQDQRE